MKKFYLVTFTPQIPIQMLAEAEDENEAYELADNADWQSYLIDNFYDLEMDAWVGYDAECIEREDIENIEDRYYIHIDLTQED